MEITVRCETPSDINPIRVINEHAFGQPIEGQIVDRLRAQGGVSLSLVALSDRQLVGHILYSPVSISTGEKEIIGAGLGPMAVLPPFQRQGVGTALVAAGNQMLREAGAPFIVVLGHPEYYPRFGFVPASKYKIRCEWEVPDDVFMVLAIQREVMEGTSGQAKYRPEFSSAA
jgi:putative acetyltransferase